MARPSRWQAAANHSSTLNPTLSTIRDRRTMLMANGQMPTPNNSPFCVSVNPNSTPHASIENARRMKQKDVATNAAKHTAKVFLASADATMPPVIVASVLMLPTPSNFELVRESSDTGPGAVRLARFQNRFDECHDARARDRIRRKQ